ncbi:MAG: BrnT family toxin [Pseudomonadota bacterium]|nr:BrnT family toxin [Pseudomonadota bacterium]
MIEVLENNPRFQRKEAGYRAGEDVYAAFGQTDTGRFLSVFFVYTQGKRAIIVSARDMTQKERMKYDR